MTLFPSVTFWSLDIRTSARGWLGAQLNPQQGGKSRESFRSSRSNSHGRTVRGRAGQEGHQAALRWPGPVAMPTGRPEHTEGPGRGQVSHHAGLSREQPRQGGRAVEPPWVWGAVERAPCDAWPQSRQQGRYGPPHLWMWRWRSPINRAIQIREIQGNYSHNQVGVIPCVRGLMNTRKSIDKLATCSSS